MEQKLIHPKARVRDSRLPQPANDHSHRKLAKLPLMNGSAVKSTDDAAISADPPPTVPATTILPSSGNDANVEAKKYFTFNETGNIMISTTASSTDSIQQDVRNVFNEVTVFFAAMTKAITNTSIPGSDPKQYYSVYDYDALERLIGGSGLFIEMTKERIDYSTQSFGANFSKELIESLLGLATGTGALSFATGLISSMGQAGVDLSYSQTSQSGRVGNIVFVCEYMLGIPLVSAIVVSVKTDEVLRAVKIGPCASANMAETRFEMVKEVFLFVSPAFIKQYSGDLDSVIDNTDYNEFVDYLQDLLTGQAFVMEMVDQQNNSAPSILANNAVYTIKGANLGQGGMLTFGLIPDGVNDITQLTNVLQVSSWRMSEVAFKGWASGSYQSSAADDEVCIYSSDLQTLLGTSSGPYTTLTAKITGLKDTSGNNAPINLAIATDYILEGSSFGTSLGTLYLKPSESATPIPLTIATAADWTDTSIKFQVPDGTNPIDNNQFLYVYGPADTKNAIAITVNSYNIAQ